ncbi:hypothetical protein L3Q82_010835, partial [Scortum barcoo]
PPQKGLRQGTEEENFRPIVDPLGFRRNNAVFIPVVELWTSSISSTGCLRVYGSLPNQSTCALWIWRRHSTMSLVVFCRGVLHDVVLLASSNEDLQHILRWFAAECEVAGMRISTSKSEAMVLDQKRVACPLRVGGEVLPQVEEFKYLGVLFTSEGKMEPEVALGICFGCPLDASLGRCSRHIPPGDPETQDTLEKRLCLSAGLGTPQSPPGRAGGSVWGEGSLGISAQTAASANPVPV